MHGGPHGLSQAELEAKEKAQAEGTWGKRGTAARDRDRRTSIPSTHSMEDIEKIMADAMRREEQLDPEAAEQFDRARALSLGLREGPLVAGLQARQTGEEGLAEQFKRLQTAPSEVQHDITQRGAGLGGRILTRQGPRMAAEFAAKFKVGQQTARLRSLAESGQIVNLVANRLGDMMRQEGINMTRTAALNKAISMMAVEAARQFGRKKPGDKTGAEMMGDVGIVPRTGTPTAGEGVYDARPSRADTPDYESGYQYGQGLDW